MTYRAEQFAYACILSALGFAVAVGIVMRAVSDAIDQAVTLQRDRCPDVLPDWVDDGSAL